MCVLTKVFFILLSNSNFRTKTFLRRAGFFLPFLFKNWLYFYICSRRTTAIKKFPQINMLYIQKGIPYFFVTRRLEFFLDSKKIINIFVQRSFFKICFFVFLVRTMELIGRII